MLQISPSLAIDEREIDERFVRASGPGGQNVNKVATAVELRFDIRASSLPDEVKSRLLTVAGKRVTFDGVLLIDSREHRTQGQNREEARSRLVALIRRAARPLRKRTATRPTLASREKRLTSKKHRGQVKAQRARGERDD